jgi:hypothetical protein
MLRLGYISRKRRGFSAIWVAFAQRFSTMPVYDSFAAHVVHCAKESAKRPIADVLMLIRGGIEGALVRGAVSGEFQ